MSSKSISDCHLCGSESLREIPEYRDYFRVTSDVKPWTKGGQLRWCEQCGATQTLLDEQWHADCRRIYDQYSIYDLSSGVEQQVFDAGKSETRGRSARLIAMLKPLLSLPTKGEFLDVGCGNGATLKAFAEEYPGWGLTGSDVHDSFKNEIENIAGHGRFVRGDLGRPPGVYDAISLIHVFEHIPWPADFLRSHRDLLSSNGVLIIQVPDCEATPFVHIVADHATHFTLPVLANLVRDCGFEPIIALKAVFGKELCVVSRKATSSAAVSVRDVVPTYQSARNLIQSLGEQVRHAREIVSNVPGDGSFGLFGTSITATWMYLELDGKVQYFVDEDLNRVGRTHLGLPVIAPHQVPAGGEVLLCLTHPVAVGVAERLKRSTTKWHLPAAT